MLLDFSKVSRAWAVSLSRPSLLPFSAVLTLRLSPHLAVSGRSPGPIVPFGFHQRRRRS